MVDVFGQRGCCVDFDCLVQTFRRGRRRRRRRRAGGVFVGVERLQEFSRLDVILVDDGVTQLPERRPGKIIGQREEFDVSFS